MKIELTGGSIKLRNTLESDIDTIIGFELDNCEFVHRDTRERHKELIDDDNCLHLSVLSLGADQLVGHIILSGIASKNSSLEFRRIAISQKGQGYGREALQLLKKFCFGQLKFHRLWLDVFDDNQRAIRLYESEGFKLEGILRDVVKTQQGYRSQRIYSILENEYKTT